MGDLPTNWEDFGQIPPQGAPQTDRTSTKSGTRWEVIVSTSVIIDGGGGVTGGGYLRLLPPEHDRTVH